MLLEHLEVTEEHLRGSFGTSIFDLALSHGREAIVAHLVPLVTVPRDAPFRGLQSPIRNSSFFQKLFEASGLDVEETDSNGMTLLQHAMKWNKQDIARFLVEKAKARADLATLARPAGFWPSRQIIPKTLFDACLEQGSAIWVAKPAGSDKNPGWFVELLLQSGAFQLPGNSFGLLRRVGAEAKACADHIMKAIAARWCPEADSFARSDAGAKMLREAASLQVPLLVGALVKGGVSLTATDAKAGTALHIAVKAKNGEVVRLLLEADADAMATRPGDGATPLDLAETAGWTAGVQLIRPWQMRSGDGTLANVGIKTRAQICCDQCRQRFDSSKALELHSRFTHEVVNQLYI